MRQITKPLHRTFLPGRCLRRPWRRHRLPQEGQRRQSQQPRAGIAPRYRPAPTATLTADPLAIDLGQSVVLNWRTTERHRRHHRRHRPGQRQRHPDRLALQLHQLPSHRQGRRRHHRSQRPRHRPRPRRAHRLPPPTTATWAPTPPSTRTSRTPSSTTTATTSVRTRRPPSPQAATYLAAHPAIKVVIGGYCDDRGSAEYNLALGENRANAANTALVSAGVAASRIRVISYGKEKQFCTEENEACWQQNRRAQFSLDR